MVDKIDSAGAAALAAQSARQARPERTPTEAARVAEAPPAPPREVSRELYADTRASTTSEPMQVDLEAVKRIKTLIEEGRYPIDLAKIARKMVELDLPPQNGNS